MFKIIRVWGALTVLTHWTVTFLLLFLYLDIQNLVLHEFIGGTITMLLVGRIYYTIKEPETKYETYQSYSVSLSLLSNYIQALISKTAKQYIALNPISRLIIILLIVFLGLTCITGVILLFSDHFSIIGISSEDLYEHHTETLSSFFKSIDNTHQLFSSISIYLILLHIIEVLLTSLYFKQNIFKSMITGLKNIDNK